MCSASRGRAAAVARALESPHVFRGAASCLTMCGQSWNGLVSRFEVARELTMLV